MPAQLLISSVAVKQAVAHCEQQEQPASLWHKVGAECEAALLEQPVPEAVLVLTGLALGCTSDREQPLLAHQVGDDLEHQLVLRLSGTVVSNGTPAHTDTRAARSAMTALASMQVVVCAP